MTATLQEFWKFDDADLAANRNGQLSEKQKAFLTGQHKTQKNTFLGVGAAVVFLFLCVPALVLGSRVVSPSQSLPAGIGLGFVGAFAVPVLAVLAIYLLRANKKADLTIRSTAGKAAYSWGTKRVRNPGNRARPYEDVRVQYLSLGEKKFEVHKDLPNMIGEGEEWRIYYTSYPFRFLSGEKIS